MDVKEQQEVLPNALETSSAQLNEILDDPEAVPLHHRMSLMAASSFMRQAAERLRIKNSPAEHTARTESDRTEHTAHAMYLHEKKGEDRILAGKAENGQPLLVIADGVSAVESSLTGEVKTGVSGETANITCSVAFEQCREVLATETSVDHVLTKLKDIHASIPAILTQERNEGATTLITAGYWYSPQLDKTFLCYAATGNGALYVLSPGRLPEQLLAPGEKNAITAKGVKGANGMRGSTTVGCKMLEKGDVVYGGSDGILGLDKWLKDNKRVLMPYFIASNAKNPQMIQQTLTACDEYTDDAVMGILT